MQGGWFWLKCRSERDGLAVCLDKWLNDEDFKEKVTLEYLNERSHFRQTGQQTKRYKRGNLIHRDVEKDGPALDANGKYRPQKPKVSYHILHSGQNDHFLAHKKSTYLANGGTRGRLEFSSSQVDFAIALAAAAAACMVICAYVYSLCLVKERSLKRY